MATLPMAEKGLRKMKLINTLLYCRETLQHIDAEFYTPLNKNEALAKIDSILNKLDDLRF